MAAAMGRPLATYLKIDSVDNIAKINLLRAFVAGLKDDYGYTNNIFQLFAYIDWSKNKEDLFFLTSQFKNYDPELEMKLLSLVK